MRNQELNHLRVGSPRLLLGLVALFVIWQQCRAFPHDIMPKCSEPTIPTNCKNGSYSYLVNNCPHFFCYMGVKDSCNFEDLQCGHDFRCKCNECMNCKDIDCNMRLECENRSPAKRLPYRLPSWYYRARWENLSQKYVEPNYDDEILKFA